MSVVAEQIEKAQDVLSALCKNPSSFTMRVPADEERDTDLIIAKALRYANEMRIVLDKILKDDYLAGVISSTGTDIEAVLDGRASTL